MDFSLFFINYTFLTLFVVIISNRIMNYINLLITMSFCYFFHVGLWQRIDKIEEKDVLVLIFKIRLLLLSRISLPKSGFLSAERKIVRLRMIFHSAENDFACCCKRFYAVCQLHHPYNEIERKKGSHPSYKLWFNPLR